MDLFPFSRKRISEVRRKGLAHSRCVKFISIHQVFRKFEVRAQPWHPCPHGLLLTGTCICPASMTQFLGPLRNHEDGFGLHFCYDGFRTAIVTVSNSSLHPWTDFRLKTDFMFKLERISWLYNCTLWPYQYTVIERKWFIVTQSGPFGVWFLSRLLANIISGSFSLVNTTSSLLIRNQFQIYTLK